MEVPPEAYMLTVIVRSQELIERGGIDCLVDLVKSRDDGMCVNAAWAIANCLYKGTWEEKQMVMNKLGWNTLNSCVPSRFLEKLL